jgi:hypothetical protein
MTYASHLLSIPRLPFTAAYFGSIGLTLYFSLGVSQISQLLFVMTSSSQSPAADILDSQLRSTILTLISAIIQLACLLWYLVSYFPMGSSGLRMATTFGARRAAAWVSG